MVAGRPSLASVGETRMAARRGGAQGMGPLMLGTLSGARLRGPPLLSQLPAANANSTEPNRVTINAPSITTSGTMGFPPRY
jgi:hypothetical protein